MRTVRQAEGKANPGTSSPTPSFGLRRINAGPRPPQAGPAGQELKDEAVSQVRVLTPDKDLAQCLSGHRVVQVNRSQQQETDEAAFRAAKGYGPESVPDFLALVGDAVGRRR